jgi:glyoxylase-like metal-dependent hydrolase (beta-lactamase superfamily II)
MAAGSYFQVEYPASAREGELQLGVTYTIWLPPGTERLRGVIVHQHGCGSGACRGGETAAYDLHWQALAEKWDCALLGPSYRQEDKQNCRLWCDPRNGSHKTFLRALDDLAEKSKHEELKSIPWCLWGHSGGGFWASLMQTMYPDRIVAVWLRSGTAFAVWEKGEIPKPEVPAAAYQIPTMCNPGAKEKDDKRFQGAWNGSLSMFRAYRAKGALIGFAPDPRTGHECGDSRYLAIPFFDACLGMRLPDKGSKSQQLKPVDAKLSWLAAEQGDQAQQAASCSGKLLEAVWLPDERVAKAWMEYVKSGAVGDSTPPPAPFNIKTTARTEGPIEITWDASADLESGVQAFVIQRDGREIGQVPEKPVGRFGRALFQTMSYHDTPEKPLPEMRFVDPSAKPGEKHEYRVIAVNSVGLRSQPAATAKDEAFPAHRVIGNTYYVGSKLLATYLVTTPDGHILINSGFEETVPLIRDSVESLGFKMRDVKILLASHAHSDHVAGHAKLKELTGAKVYAMRGDAEVIASGGLGQYLYTDSHWKPCKVDRVLEDGDQVKLGDVTLAAHRTPGHTRGCTTWTWRVVDQGKPRDVVVIGSPNVNPGYRLVGNKQYPQIADDFSKTFAVLKALPCDVFLGAHGAYYGMEAKYERLKTDKQNPFIDPEGYRAYVEDREKAFRQVLLEQQKK